MDENLLCLCRQLSDGDRSAIPKLEALLRKASKAQLLQFFDDSEGIGMSWEALKRSHQELVPLGKAMEERAAKLRVELCGWREERGY